MGRSDLNEFKDVIEKVENKLIVAKKIYAASIFTLWLLAMSLCYVIFSFNFHTATFFLFGGYWITICVVVFYLSTLLYKRYFAIERNCERAKGDKYKILFSWIFGSIVGFLIIPHLLNNVLPNTLIFSISLLSTIAVSLFGEFLVLKDFEIIPSILFTFFGTLILTFFHTHLTIAPIAWTGYIIALGYLSTIILYLASVFKCE